MQRPVYGRIELRWWRRRPMGAHHPAPGLRRRRALDTHGSLSAKEKCVRMSADTARCERNAAYFFCNRAPALIVGRSPWTAADALVGLSRLSRALVLRAKSGSGGPAQTRGRPGGLPHEFCGITDIGKTMRHYAESVRHQLTARRQSLATAT